MDPELLYLNCYGRLNPHNDKASGFIVLFASCLHQEAINVFIFLDVCWIRRVRMLLL